MATSSKAYSASHFQVVLEGNPVGFLRTIEGGTPYATVRIDEVSADGIVRKSPAAARYEPIVMTLGLPVDRALLDWMQEMLSGQRSTKSGAIVLLGQDFKESSRVEFFDAVITEIRLPGVDGSSKQPGGLSVTLQPARTSSTASMKDAASAKGGPLKSKAWILSNFRFKITGLESECGKVNAIDDIVVSRPDTRIAGDAGADSLTVSNLRFSVAESQSARFRDWFTAFVIESSEGDERSGTLAYLDQTRSESLLTVSLSNLGILRVGRERLETNAEVIARSRVECYVESISIAAPTPPSGGTGTGPGATGGDAGVPPTAPIDAELADVLGGIASGRLRGNDAVRATMRMASARAVGATGESAEEAAKAVARRLAATVRAVPTTPSLPGRIEGVALGERWASESATLEELEQIAALESGEWTAMRLAAGHSLLGHLRDAAVIASDADQSTELSRDGFVEGIVAATASVLRAASPHLKDR